MAKINGQNAKTYPNTRLFHKCYEQALWGDGLQNLMGGGQGLTQHMQGASRGGGGGGLSKNICEGVHLIVKLPAICLQACKFTKTELLLTYFSRILIRF